jgi:hypothetical protein
VKDNAMKKIVFYIPVILFAVILAVMSRMGSISPVAFVWIALFLGCGFLLSKGKFWGGILGILPGIHWIYMGTKHSGQMINELPLGIIILIFYILCSGFVFYKSPSA